MFSKYKSIINRLGNQSNNAGRWGLTLGLLVLTAAVISSSPSAQAVDVQPIGQMAGWELSFNDEFTGATLDSTKWNTCYPWGTEDGCYHGNNELNWYQPQNVSVDNGALHLTAKNEPVTRNGVDYDYTSGMVTTHGKFNIAYGYAEMRAKLTQGQGLWPAFWLLPENGLWPPEIDVMEQLGHEPNRIYQDYHWVDDGQHQHQQANYLGSGYADSYHTYGVDWSPQSIIYYIDGVERHRITDPTVITALPQYLLANLAVGGDWPGAPDAATAFPQSLDIDYIRAWQRAPQVTVQSLGTQVSPNSTTPTIFTTTLESSRPFVADTLVVGVRDQNGQNVDASALSNVMMSGIQTFTFQRTYPPGTYTYWVAYLRNGAWTELEPKKTVVIPQPSGLKATYYDNSNFTGTSVSRIDSNINFSWGNGSPAAGIGADTFSARWTGKIAVPRSGTYTFYTSSDDGVRLWVNGKLIIDNWTTHSVTENAGTISLTAGQQYAIRMDYYDNTSLATAKLLWKVPGTTSKVIVPQGNLLVQ